VIVWPVVVQGDAASGQVAAAIRGFDAMTPNGQIPRADLLIVARGGGSVEDLWCFNDESLARTVAAATIPIISAVGHETDTTLIDFVSDRRAPTPTGAAEVATPVLADLRAAVFDLERRLDRAGARLLEERRVRLRAVARGLPVRPEELVAVAQQRLDYSASRLGSGLGRNVEQHHRRLVGVAGRFSPRLLDRAVEQRVARLDGLERRLMAGLGAHAARHERRLLKVIGSLSPAPLLHRLEQRTIRLSAVAARLDRIRTQAADRASDRLAGLARALASLDPRLPRPGFARVDDETGRMVASATDLSPGQAVTLTFTDGARAVTVDGTATTARPAPRPRPAAADQGNLF
jgi:exodeoxyribonuclease VII large subunit